MTDPNKPIKPLAWKKRADGVLELNTEESGMTYMEWLTGMALCGLSGSPRVGDNTDKAHAQAAVKYAKATIDELNKVK